MSFVAKVLEHSGHLERRVIHNDMETLIQKQRDLQFEVHQLAENKFSQFHLSLSDSAKLTQRVEDVTKDITGLEKKISGEIKSQLTLSTSEFQCLSKQLSDCKAIEESLDYLVQIYDYHESAETALKDKKYADAIYALDKIDELFKHPLCGDDSNIKICISMKNESFEQRIRVEQDMTELWSDCVKWSFPNTQQVDPDHSNDHAPSFVSLSIGKEGCDHSVLAEVVEGLHMTNLLSMRMKTFIERFQNYVVPLILEPFDDVVVSLNSSKTVSTLNISIASDKTTGKGKGSKPSLPAKRKSIPEERLYVTVFDRLTRVLTHLNEMLLDIEFGNKADKDGSTNGTLMNLLGQETSESLLETLQKDILAKAIPTSAKDLAGFESVKSATHGLEDKLVSLGYLSPDSQTLQKGVENVDLLFSNKKCALILEQARNLMTSDLLNQTVAISDNKPRGDLPPLTKSTDKQKKPEALSDKLLSSDTFKMPQCKVSENIEAILQLAYTTLHEASESSPECATQMYFAVHSMLEMFSFVVPTHHKQNIEKLPQMAALHHNNCMYIAHHLMTLGHQFAQALPRSETVTFVSHIQHIRDNGWDCFLDQLTRQKDILLECLEEAGGFASLEEEVNCQQSERAIKQVLHQLKHLNKVWEPVLPVNLYHKAMGKLIQAVVERITDTITAMEDITQDACVALTSVLGPLEEDCALVMGVKPAELPCHVQNWARLTSVKTVFNSNLIAIDDLWADGKGPLAATFSPVEMKQMIRALFQNTDRRADLLSKIR